MLFGVVAYRVCIQFNFTRQRTSYNRWSALYLHLVLVYNPNPSRITSMYIRRTYRILDPSLDIRSDIRTCLAADGVLRLCHQSIHI